MYVWMCVLKFFFPCVCGSVVWNILVIIILLLIFVTYIYIYIYIYIYSHPQTNCFVLSELFSVARHAGRSKPWSKPVQLWTVFQTTRPPSGPRWLRGFWGIFFIFRNSSSSLCLHFFYVCFHLCVWFMFYSTLV